MAVLPGRPLLSAAAAAPPPISFPASSLPFRNLVQTAEPQIATLPPAELVKTELHNVASYVNSFAGSPLTDPAR